jgi:hypothetical protein
MFMLKRFCALALWALAGASDAAGPTGLLNDTGQTLCVAINYGAMSPCTQAYTDDTALFKRQDGRFGRDPAVTAKVGGGVGGFDFTRICFNGATEGSSNCGGSLIANGTGVATVSPSTDWACTKDNVTNLIWSLQTQTATWHDAVTVNFPNMGHNSATRCGYADNWRMPTRRELLGIAVHDSYSNPTIDVSYFPNTQGAGWSLEPYVPDSNSAWRVLFVNGSSHPVAKSDVNYVRLVRSGP